MPNLTGLVPSPTAARALESLTSPGFRTYHGSPYDFDRFDASKIGSGEGAQAYGRGLYFGDENTAAGYRDATKWRDWDSESPAGRAAMWADRFGGRDGAVEALQYAIDNSYFKGKSLSSDLNRAAIDFLRGGATVVGDCGKCGTINLSTGKTLNLHDVDAWRKL